MDLRVVLDMVGTWPAEDRLRLIGAIWEGLEEAPEAVVLTEAQPDDLQRRLDAYRDNPGAGLSWEEMKARFHI